jgi:hypothetical protein
MQILYEEADSSGRPLTAFKLLDIIMESRRQQSIEGVFS